VERWNVPDAAVNYVCRGSRARARVAMPAAACERVIIIADVGGRGAGRQQAGPRVTKHYECLSVCLSAERGIIVRTARQLSQLIIARSLISLV